jgi:hypothetical protein
LCGDTTTSRRELNVGGFAYSEIDRDTPKTQHVVE